MDKNVTDPKVEALMTLVPEGQSPRVYIELVKTQVLGTDKTGKARPDEDLMFFMYVAKKSGLDPLAKQIYAVYRWDGRLGKEKMTIQTGIDGFRAIAARTGEYGGQDEAQFDNEEKPTKATVTVYKINKITGDRMPTSATARWSEYVQKGANGDAQGLWGKMPHTMLAKCAEALALRKAFPNELGGLYTPEETAQADNPLKGLEAPTKGKVVKSEGDSKIDITGNRSALENGDAK